MSIKKYPKIWEVSFCWYEEYCPHLFFHPDINKTSEEFKKDIESLFKKYGNEYIKQEDSWAGMDKFVEFICTKISELGYVPVQKESYPVWGGTILKGDEENDDAIEKLIGKKIYNKMIKHNTDMEIELFTRRKTI